MKSLLAMLTALAVPQLAMAGDVDSGDTAWILTSTALVLFMTLPGLALFNVSILRREGFAFREEQHIFL